MKAAWSKVVWTVGLTGLSAAASAAALADQPKHASPQEPAGFVTGAVIGGFAAGPIGAVVGAGLGTWLGNRVHRASEAAKAEAQVAALKDDREALERKAASLEGAKSDLEETNRALTARLDQLAHSVEVAQEGRDDAARAEAARVLDGLQGDVLFRTGSAEIPPETAHEIEILAGTLAKSPALNVKLDGYADPRGTTDLNLKLSEARANAVRDLFLAAGVPEESLEVNAYGKSQSAASDSDGYAFERRVRLTLQAAGPASVAQAVSPLDQGAGTPSGDVGASPSKGQRSENQ
ncbi:MAG: OmpA family protein [Steroidobacteraceae bacterium]|jgi:outer membrane protein OmpA-like peptidoglycan-associated protein